MADRIAAFEASLGLERPVPELRRRIAEIAMTYCPPNVLDQTPAQSDRLADLREPVRAAETNARLRTIAKQAIRLRGLLTSDEGDDWGHIRTLDRLLPYRDQAAWARALTALSNAALSLQIRDRGGRSGNLWLREIVAQLALVYREVLGREPKRPVHRGKDKPLRGPFFDFVKAFFQAFAHLPADSKIDEAIRHTLRPRRRYG